MYEVVTSSSIMGGDLRSIERLPGGKRRERGKRRLASPLQKNREGVRQRDAKALANLKMLFRVFVFAIAEMEI